MSEAALPEARQVSDLDLQEQDARIRNFDADTALKLQTFENSRLRAVVAVGTLVAAIGGVIVGAIALYLDHRAPPAPTYIFIQPASGVVV